jgi:hypothetical protein
MNDLIIVMKSLPTLQIDISLSLHKNVLILEIIDEIDKEQNSLFDSCSDP